MKLHELKPAVGSVKKNKRIGRGQASGRGGTATRGHKGAQSRSGYSRKPGFEGGQMPIQRRIPKHGFKNPTRVDYLAFNVSDVEHYASKFGVKELTVDLLREKGVIRRSDRVKLAGDGEITSAVSVTFHKATKGGLEKLEKAGGSFTPIDTPEKSADQ